MRTQQRVLLVEDDDGVRELVDGVLWHNGFSVVSYRTAEDALQHKAPFDLLLTDIGLPGLDGRALAVEISRRSPGVPVLLMSADVTCGDAPEELRPQRFIHKPFTSQELVDQVQQLLAA